MLTDLFLLKWKVYEGGVGHEVGIREKWWIFDTCQAKELFSNQRGRPGKILSKGVILISRTIVCRIDREERRD